MSRLLALFFAIAVCALAGACTSEGVTTPSSSGPGYDGQWSGTTLQGAPISFTVSADQTVTSITVGYNFNGCSGSKTFSTLSLKIGTAQPPLPTPQPPFNNPGFGYGSGPPEEANFIQVTGTFTSNQTSTGVLGLLNFPNCGNSVATWNATKH